MQVEYTFPHIPRFRRIRMLVSNHGNKLSMKLKGPFALLLKPIFAVYFIAYGRLDRVGVRKGANVYTLFVPPIPSKAHTRTFENLVRRQFYGERIPMAVTIAVTNKCQCRCRHCSLPDVVTKEPELSVEELQQVVQQSLELGVTNITFTGGEPLLHHDLEQVIATVPEDKAVSLVFTNALELTRERIRSLKRAGLYGIQVSVDSPDPEEHDAWRGIPGLFDKVRQAIRHAHEEDLMLGLSSYATNEFVEKGKLAKLAALAAEWGAHELTVFDVIATGRLLHHPDIMLTPENRQRLIAEELKLRKQYKGRVLIVTQAWTNSGKGYARLIGCLAGHFQYHISAIGEFRPCDFTPFSFGSVRQSSVAELWKKLTEHPAYRDHCYACRMQMESFRKAMGIGS